jgi:hypothetical protein
MSSPSGTTTVSLPEGGCTIDWIDPLEPVQEPFGAKLHFQSLDSSVHPINLNVQAAAENPHP